MAKGMTREAGGWRRRGGGEERIKEVGGSAGSEEHIRRPTPTHCAVWARSSVIALERSGVFRQQWCPFKWEGEGVVCRLSPLFIMVSSPGGIDCAPLSSCESGVTTPKSLEFEQLGKIAREEKHTVNVAALKHSAKIRW